MRLVLPLLLVGSGAWAECPRAADLAQGVRVLYADDRELTFRSTDDPALLSVRSVRPSDGASHLRDVAWGLFDLRHYASSLGEPESGTIYWVGEPGKHMLEPAEFPRPTPDTRVTFADARDWGGFSVPVYREVYRLRSEGQVTLAGCTFRAFEVTLERTDLLPLPNEAPNAPKVVSTQTYLTDLGFAVDSWIGSTRDGYPAADVISIEATR